MNDNFEPPFSRQFGADLPPNEPQPTIEGRRADSRVRLLGPLRARSTLQAYKFLTLLSER